MNKYERDNIRRLRPYLPECTVLLRKNGAFPLDRPCRIFACGNGVRFTVKGGTGSGEVNSRFFINVEQGLREAGFDVETNDWSTMYSYYLDEAKRRHHEAIKTRAKDDKLSLLSASMGMVMPEPEYRIRLDYSCDAAIYVLARISGEGNDRMAVKGDFKLTDSEVRDILDLNARYDKFMLVLNTGGPVDLSPVADVGNILVLSQLGVETGAALADILLGRSYPSGKLATTWSAYEDYCSVGEFGKRDDTRYREGIFVGYRYFDAFGPEPMFPFGYGLGYTDFEMKNAAVSADGPEITVAAELSNIGGWSGKETLQVYLSCPQGRLGREIKSLAGFAKTAELEPGASQTVSVSFDIRDFAAYDSGAKAEAGDADESRTGSSSAEAAAGGFVLEEGDYIILAGTSSANALPVGVLHLGSDHIVREAKSLFPAPDFEDLKPADLTRSDENTAGSDAAHAAQSGVCRGFDISGLEAIDLNLSDCTAEHPEGTGSGIYRAGDAAISYLSGAELAYLNTGAFDPKKRMPNVIGDSASTVAGAAGETTSMFRQFGIDNIVMADGPAGVRIARRYYEDKKGRHSVGLPIPESMLEFIPAPARKLIEIAGRPKKGAKIEEQFCTAIPIATAVAQSFNTEFAEICGDVVGSEMDIFGIDLWLAPALNIHRNVLCGRNFEYFSEDPVVSGKFAAALTRGVQSHPGRGATIKHFAANNQETNRYANNSVISERALREIYLKGFGICIRESDPMALMTSYNLLNGEHTSESRALTEIAREEFGFDGLIMTDWVIAGDLLLAGGSKYGTPDPAKVAAAGSSLFMPGGRKDHRKILKGLENGTVTIEQLRENAGWILHVLRRLGKY